MGLVSTQTMLRKAKREGYAIGHFNTSNMEFTQAIIRAADELRAPVIIATSKKAIAYAGYESLFALVQAQARQTPVPVALHLDHGPDHTHVQLCLKHGWTSIMRDASALPFNENVRETRKSAILTHKCGASFEAELGVLKGEEGWVRSSKSIFTDPLQAKEFVKKTGVDSLAVSVGTSHGAQKFSGTARIDFKRIKEIAAAVRIPLVLHGASEVPVDTVKSANKLGARIANAKGVPNAQIKRAIKAGICKVNTDTDLRIEFTQSLYERLRNNPDSFDPREILGEVRDELQRAIMRRMKVLGCQGQA